MANFSQHPSKFRPTSTGVYKTECQNSARFYTSGRTSMTKLTGADGSFTNRLTVVISINYIQYEV